MFTTRLPQPYTECMANLDSIHKFDSELYRAIINSNRTYRQTDCFDLCFQKRVIDVCNCYMNYLDRLSGTVSCSSMSQINCSIYVGDEFLASDYKSICSPYCPIECETMMFTVSTSFSDYPSRQYAEQTLTKNSIIASKFRNATHKLTYEELKRSVLSLNVYYEHMSYTYISQKPKTKLFDLISNVGGLFGICLGASFLSFVEILEGCLELLFILAIKSDKLKRAFQSKRT